MPIGLTFLLETKWSNVSLHPRHHLSHLLHSSNNINSNPVHHLPQLLPHLLYHHHLSVILQIEPKDIHASFIMCNTIHIFIFLYQSIYVNGGLSYMNNGGSSCQGGGSGKSRVLWGVPCLDPGSHSPIPIFIF